jgi:TolB-like protein
MAAFYIVAAWVVLQMADLAFPGLAVPDQAIRFVWMGAFLGFPLALIFAWRYDITAEGIARTPAADPAVPADLPLQTSDYLALGGLALVAGVIAYGVLSRIRAVETPTAAMPQERVVYPNSIAVLPLENLSGDPDQAYFAAGMHEALIAGLSRIAALRVTSRTSTRQFASTDLPIPAIGRELGVAMLVEGSVQRSNGAVRINVQAIDAATDEHLWADSFHRDIQDVLTLQNEVASAIAREIQVRLTPGEKNLLSRARRVNPETYELYLKGMFELNKFTPAGVTQGLDFLHEAIRKDPGDPLPYAQLAQGYIRIGHGPGAPPDAFPKARAAARKALMLDPDLAEAQAALAEAILYYEWDWTAAQRAFERAFELNAHQSVARAHHGYYQLLFGRLEESVAELQHAREIDPLEPLWPAWIGWILLFEERYEEALALAQETLDLDPGYPWGYYLRGYAYALQGRHEEAIAAIERAAEITPIFGWGPGYAHAMAGHRDVALRIAGELEMAPRPDAWGLAEIYTALGEHDKALDWLETGFEQRRDWIPWIAYNAAYKPLFDEPRFMALLDKLELSPSR